MDPVVVQVTGQGSWQAFLDVPELVYGEKGVPPSASRLKTGARFSRDNPLLQHARFANFVALADGAPVGRITASVDDFNPRPDEGFWGSFECVNSPAVAKKLFDAAAKWLAAQNKNEMIGPATLNTNEQVGLLIKGFQYARLPEIPYNPPYYQALVESCGFERFQDLECYKWSLPKQLPEELQKETRLKNVILRPVNYSMMAREAVVVQEVFNQMMSGLWGFIPLSRADTYGFLLECARRVPPDLFIIAEHEGRPVGMLVCIPYAVPAREGSGGMVRLALGGISPGYRGMGIHRMVINEMYRQLFRLGFTEGEASQVAESNLGVKMKVLKPVMGGEIIKIFRVYKRKLK